MDEHAGGEAELGITVKEFATLQAGSLYFFAMTVAFRPDDAVPAVRPG
jgi:hypothetical protein